MKTTQTLYTVKQFSEAEPAFSEGGLRWLIFNEETNGMKAAGAFPKCGGKRLIHRENFLKQFNSLQEQIEDAGL